MGQKGHSGIQKQLRGSPFIYNIGHTPPRAPHLLLSAPPLPIPLVENKKRRDSNSLVLISSQFSCNMQLFC